MLVKEQTVVEPDVTTKDQRPRKLLPDYARQARGYLESRIAAAFSGSVTWAPETIPDHDTAEHPRIASVLQAQREEGNFYVQQAIANYRKKAHLPPTPPPEAPLGKTAAEGKPVPPPVAASPVIPSKMPAAAEHDHRFAPSPPKPGVAKGPGAPKAEAYGKPRPAGASPTKPAMRAVPPAAGAPVAHAAKPKETPLTPEAKPGPTPAPVPKSPAAPSAPVQKADGPKPGAPGAKATGDQKLPPNPAKEETKAESLSIDQAGKAQVTKVTTPAKQSVEGSGGGVAAGAEVDQWKTKVNAAAQKNLTPPDLKDAEQAADKIKAEGDTLLQQQQQKQPDYLADASSKLPPPPKLENPPEAQSDPVEKTSRDMVASAGNSRLTDQTLPPLEQSPGYSKDDNKVPPRMPSFTPPAPAPPPADAAPTDKSGADQVKTDTTKTDDAQKKIDRPPTPDQSASPRQLTLQDKGPVPKPSVPEEMKSNVADALAMILSKSGDAAKEIASNAELAAFPGGVLKDVDSTVAEKHVDPEKQDIEKELHQIADAAHLEKGVIDKRKAKLVSEAQEQGDKAADQLDSAAQENKQKAQTQGQEQRTAIQAAANSMQSNIEKKQEAANLPLDNKAVEEREQKLTEQLRKDAATHRAQYSKALEKRQSELDQAATQYEGAYQRAAKQEADEIKALYKDDDEKGRVESRPSLDWADKEVKTLKEKLPFLKRDAAKETDSFKTALNKEELAAIEVIHAWANDHVSSWRSIWRHIVELFTGWASDAKATTEAWEEVRDQETTNQIVDDFSLIGHLKDLAAQGNIEELKKALAGLNQDQQALLMLFYATGSDSVMTVASAVLARIESRRIPKVTEQLRQEVLDLDWDKLNLLGQAQDPGFDADRLAWEVHNAIAGIGTNEQRLFAAIGRRTPVQMAAMKKRFHDLFNADMQEEIDDDLSGDEAKRAKAGLANDKTGEDIFALHDALDSFSTDNATVMQVLRNKTPEEREAIFEKYQKEYNIDLREHLHQELSDKNDRDRADALLAGDTTKADAIAVEQAMHYHWYGGAEIKELDSVYTQIRQEVEADAQARHMTTAEVEAEVKRRAQAVQVEWESAHAGGKPGAMNDAFKDKFSGAEQDLALGIAETDRTKQDAARIGMESQSTYTRDEKVLQILLAQRQRAEADVGRDTKVHLDELKQQVAEGKLTQEQYKQKLEEITKKAQQDIDDKADKNLQNLEKVYDKNYSKGWGPGALTAVVEMEMDGQEQEMARAIRKKGGHGKLDPEDEIFYSINGLGHNVDHLKHALMDENGQQRWTKEQLDAMDRSYKAKHGRGMFEDIGGEIITGRDGFDINRALKGIPQTPEDIRRDIHAKTVNELGGSGGLGFLLAPDESLALYKTATQADAVYDQYLKAKNQEKDPAKADALLKKLQRYNTYTDHAVAGTRESVDAITDHAAMVAAIVVGIVVAVATAGTATPAVVAALSALAATATSMSVKMALKGNAYSLEEMGTDAAIGAVDVAAAALTAGVGNALLRTNVLTRLAERQLAGRLLSQGIAHGVGGMVAGIPAGVTGLALNEQTWKSDDTLKTFLMGTLQTAGTGLAFGGVLSTVHGIKGPPEAHLSGKANPHPELHDVPNAKPQPDLTANAKAAADAHPLSNVETQLQPIVHADELPHSPGSAEAKLAKNVANAKALLDPATPENRMAGIDKGGGKGITGAADAGKMVKDPSKGTIQVEPGSREYHAMLNEGWTAEMLAKGLGATEIPPVPDGPPLKQGTYKGGIKTPAEAHAAYNEAMARAPGREVGIFRNLDTGEYFVQVGGATSVGAPLGVEGPFEAVLHYHPNEGHVLTYRMPSVTDVSEAMLASARLDGRPVTQFIEYPLPEGGRGRTAYRVELPPVEPGQKLKPPVITLEYIDANGTRIKKTFPGIGEFQAEWSSRTTYAEPGSQTYNDLMFGADQELHRLRSEQTGTSSPEDLPMRNKMVGGRGGTAEDFERALLRALEDHSDPRDVGERMFGYMGETKAQPTAEQQAETRKLLQADPKRRLPYYEPNERTRELLADAEKIGRERDPVLQWLLAERGKERDINFRDFIVPAMKQRMPEHSVFSVRDWAELEKTLNLRRLPWGRGMGPDLLLVDSAAKKIAVLDLTAKDTPTHLAQKQSQADALQKLLPGWTVEPARDFYHGKGFSEAQVMADLADVMRRYRGSLPSP